MSTNRKRLPVVGFYRRSEVAELLKVNDRTIDRWVRSGELDSVKMPGARNSPVLITAESVLALIERSRLVESA